MIYTYKPRELNNSISVKKINPPLRWGKVKRASMDVSRQM